MNSLPRYEDVCLVGGLPHIVSPGFNSRPTAQELRALSHNNP